MPNKKIYQKSVKLTNNSTSTKVPREVNKKFEQVYIYITVGPGVPFWRCPPVYSFENITCHQHEKQPISIQVSCLPFRSCRYSITPKKESCIGVCGL